MPKPVIFTIDDDSSVLNSVERDLRVQYGQDYRILPIDSGRAALDYLKKLQQRNETVALFLVDHRMPEMNGVEFLEEAIQAYPQAKRVLLTAYADTQAAIDSINEVGLDYYLMKPWHPPQERLYPILDELLEDWKIHVRLPYEGIRVAGTLWSLPSHQVKDFLTRHQIPYQWLDIEKDSNTRQLVEGISSEITKLPVVFFPDGKTLLQPELKELAEKVGLQTRANFFSQFSQLRLDQALAIREKYDRKFCDFRGNPFDHLAGVRVFFNVQPLIRDLMSRQKILDLMAGQRP